MTYTPNIPKSTDNPSQSQPLMLQNFQQLNTQYGTSGDHVPFTASSLNGTHKKVTLSDQTGNIPTAGLNQDVVYGVTQSGITMPYYQRDNLATIYPLAPIKAYASFISNSASGGSVTINDSFNIASITQSARNTWIITMTNACRTGVYGIVAFQSAFGNLIYSIGNNSNFTIVSSVNTPGAFFTVMVLET